MYVTEILLSAFLALAGAAYYFLHRRLNYWQCRGIPCDPPHWLYGNLDGVPKKISATEAFMQVYNRYVGTGQPFCGFYFLQIPTILALTSELVKSVLIKDFSNFADRGLYSNEEDDPLSGHLFRLGGAKWRYLRHKLSPTFTSGQMKYMFPTVLAVADQFVDTLEKDLQKSNIIEVTDFLSRFTTDVIASCAFGVEGNSLRDPNDIFREMGKRFLAGGRHSRFVYNLIENSQKLARLLHMRINEDDVTDFFMNIVRETVDYREKNNVQRKDFLNILIQLNKGALDEKSDGEVLTIEEMTAQVCIFFVAGFETSAATLSFMLYEMAQNMEIQKRLRQEILEKLAEHGNELTYELINSLPYMKQVIAETLRKYPIVSLLRRVALCDYVVTEHPNYVIEKGTPVFISVMAIHQNPDIYPEPEKFNPGRFAPEEMLKRDSINWLPFGDGPRNCIGMRFAQMQMRVALIYLLRNFEITTCHQTEIPLQFVPETILLCSKNGIYLKVQKI